MCCCTVATMLLARRAEEGNNGAGMGLPSLVTDDAVSF